MGLNSCVTSSVSFSPRHGSPSRGGEVPTGDCGLAPVVQNSIVRRGERLGSVLAPSPPSFWAFGSSIFSGGRGFTLCSHSLVGFRCLTGWTSSFALVNSLIVFATVSTKKSPFFIETFFSREGGSPSKSSLWENGSAGCISLVSTGTGFCLAFPAWGKRICVAAPSRETTKLQINTKNQLFFCASECSETNVPS